MYLVHIFHNLLGHQVKCDDWYCICVYVWQLNELWMSNQQQQVITKTTPHILGQWESVQTHCIVVDGAPAFFSSNWIMCLLLFPHPKRYYFICSGSSHRDVCVLQKLPAHDIHADTKVHHLQYINSGEGDSQKHAYTAEIFTSFAIRRLKTIRKMRCTDGSFKQASGNLNCLDDIWCLWWDQTRINTGEESSVISVSISSFHNSGRQRHGSVTSNFYYSILY